MSAPPLALAKSKSARSAKSASRARLRRAVLRIAPTVVIAATVVIAEIAKDAAATVKVVKVVSTTRPSESGSKSS